MALGDIGIDVNELDEMIARAHRLRPAKPQFTRLGATSRWFNPQARPIGGKTFYYNVMVSGDTGTRRNTVTAGAQGEFPIPGDFSFKELSVPFTDLKMFQHTLRYNEIEALRTRDPKYAVAELALTAIAQGENSLASQVNAAMHQSGNCAMGKVAGIYDLDGTSFTGAAAHTPALIQIKDGSPAAYMKGMILDIYDSASAGGSDTQNAQVLVHDVFTSKDFKYAGSWVTDKGPALIVEPCSLYGSTTASDGLSLTFDYDTAWNAVGTPAANDFLALSGEFTTNTAAFKNIFGLPDYYDNNVNIFRDTDGTLIDRDAAGNFWTNAHVVHVADAGSEDDFDPEVHFRELEDYLPDKVQTGRVMRPNVRDDKMVLPASLLGICRPALLNDAVDDAKATQRFVSTVATSMDSAKRKQLFGITGFDGWYYHSPTLGVIAMQADPAARPYCIEFCDPQSFFFLTLGGSAARVHWLDMGNGRRFQRIEGATHRTPTYYLQGGVWSSMYLANDQPGVLALIEGIKAASGAW